MKKRFRRGLTADAERCIRAADGWISNKDVASQLDECVRRIGPALKGLVQAGVLERQYRECHQTLYWRVREREALAPRFSIDWPPRFKPVFDSVQVRSL